MAWLNRSLSWTNFSSSLRPPSTLLSAVPFLGYRPDQPSGTSTELLAPGGVSITIPEGQIWRCTNKSLDASGSQVLRGPMVFQPSYTGTRSVHNDDGDGRDKWEFEITTISKPLYVSNHQLSYS